MRRVIGVTIAAAAAVGLAIGGAVPALADTQQAYIVVSAAPANTAGTSACGVFLLSAQVSSGGPAYVSAWVANSGTKTCTGWIERSANKGKSWATVSKRVAVPRSAEVFAKTADYYAGGDLARPCYQYGTGKAACGPAVTLKASKARDTGGGLPVSYVRQGATASSSAGQCEAGLASTTTTKKSTSSVDAFIVNVSGSFTKAGPSCAAVLQESVNGGKSWKTVSASHVVPAPANRVGFGFTGTYADGTGHLARVCATLSSSSKSQHCSKGW
jgi:hypothetical protein